MPTSDRHCLLVTERAECVDAVRGVLEGELEIRLSRPGRAIQELRERPGTPVMILDGLVLAGGELALQECREVAPDCVVVVLGADLDTQVLEFLRRTRAAHGQRLHRFVAELNGLDTLEAIASLVVEAAAEVLDSQRVSLMLPDPSGEVLTIAAAHGIPREVCDATRVKIGDAIAGRVFLEETSLIVDDAHDLTEGERRLRDSDATPMICACLVAAGHNAVGVLNVTSPRSSATYDEKELVRARTIAEAAAIAINNQNHRRQRDEARDSVILAMAKLAEYRDPETGSHLQRLQVYCRLLAEALADHPRFAAVIDQTFIEALVRSSPLHDIGKVGIPDHILLKPGRHTPEEFDHMRTHTKIGGDTLRSLINQGQEQQFLRMGMEIAYCHHEKWDGSGYPQGLKGEEIPVSARILALADVYDALTTRRVYKAAIDHAEVCRRIGESSGSHFDPDIVDAFLDRADEFESTARALGEDAPRLANPTSADVEFQADNPETTRAKP